MADQRARLQGIVHARFCEVFGQPHTVRGLDAHWSIALDGFDNGRRCGGCATGSA